MHLSNRLNEMEHKVITATLKIRGGSDRDCYGKKAGKGALIQWEKSATLGVSQDQTLFVLRVTEQDRATEETDIAQTE